MKNYLAVPLSVLFKKLYLFFYIAYVHLIWDFVSPFGPFSGRTKGLQVFNPFVACSKCDCGVASKNFDLKICLFHNKIDLFVTPLSTALMSMEADYNYVI